MLEQLKLEARDYLSRLRACVYMSDDLHKNMTLYMLALIENAYYEGAKASEPLTEKA